MTTKQKRDQEQPEMLFSDLTKPVRDLLLNMSNWGYIYVGRTGAGLTDSFRKETFKVGTVKACRAATQFISEQEAEILQLISVEGPRWVSYKRIEDVYYGVRLPEPVTAETKEVNEGESDL